MPGHQEMFGAGFKQASEILARSSAVQVQPEPLVAEI